MLAEIVTHTPIWVPVVFLVLLVYGGVQLRTRELSKPKLMMLPIIMTVLSIGGVLSSFGAAPAALVAWAVGVAVAVALNQIIRAPSGVRYDATRGLFHVPGGAAPLALMMTIFFAKYVVGATTALRPDIVAMPLFANGMSLLFGALSGTFLARFLRIWSTMRGSADDPRIGPGDDVTSAA